MADAGNFVIAWQSDDASGTDTSGSSIQAQRDRALLRDGLEGGTTGRWPATVPEGRRRLYRQEIQVLPAPRHLEAGAGRAPAGAAAASRTPRALAIASASPPTRPSPK
jgi:hypothetical protein